MSQRALINAGILSLHAAPQQRLVCHFKTFQHPTVPGLTVTVHPIPTLGTPAFWNQAWYNLHESFDRVLVEDARGPARRGTPAAYWSLFKQYVFPAAAYTQVVESDIAAGKYDMAQQRRDPLDSHQAYLTVLHCLKPPVDPRARRAVEHINTIAKRMTADGTAHVAHRIVLPWNVYHAYYFYWRFAEEGWATVKNEEVELIDKRSVAVIVVTTVFLLGLVGFWTLRWFLSLLFGF